MNLFKKKILLIFNKIKSISRNILILKVNTGKFSFNIDDINYRNFEIRDIKISVINHYLDKINLNNSYKIHLFNHLFMKDDIFRKKACVINYFLDKRFKIEKISAPFLSKKDKSLFKKFNLNIKKIKLNKKHITPFFLILISILIENIRLYYKKIKLFPTEKSRYDPTIKYERVLRAWVDLSENIYLKKLKKTLHKTIIHVNPGYIGDLPSKRQQKYLEYLKTNNRNYFFYVPKINIYEVVKKALMINFNPIFKDIKLGLVNIMVQRNALDNYVKYLNKNFPFIREFYTKEEFDTGTTYLTEKLQIHKIKVINSAHGLGVYCPYINYDEFYVFSRSQKNYYFGSSKFKYFNLDLSLENLKNNIKKIGLLFIGQTILSRESSPTLRAAYKKIIKYIEQITQEFHFPVFVKYHPNSIDTDKIFSKNVNIIQKIQDLPVEYNFIALTFFSTYVYELLNIFPFLIINPQGNVNLKYHFPKNESIYVKSYQEFKEKINKFLKNPMHYYEYWKELISIIKKNMDY